MSDISISEALFKMKKSVHVMMYVSLFLLLLAPLLVVQAGSGIASQNLGGTDLKHDNTVNL